MKNQLKKKIWTIGHSTHTLGEFVQWLQAFSITQLIDIRGMPGSNKFPQFNKERLEKSMPKVGIEYVHIEKLGGRRKFRENSRNTVWENKSFRAYADYMETESFEIGLKELKELASSQPTVFMCSEAVWWSCHRSMVSDRLKVDGWKVYHIMGLSKATEHPYTKPAKVKDGVLYYGTPEE